MATVTSVKLQKERGSNKDGKIGCTREYLVAFDGPADAFAAMTAKISGGAAVPQYGEVHPGNGLIFVSSIDAELAGDSLRHFKVTVEYSSNETKQTADNPLERAPEISWSYAEATEPYFLDRTPESEQGPKPVTNSAGEPFEQYLERECGTLTITISRNESAYDAAALDQYSHTVNSKQVRIDNTIYDPGTLKLSPITATKATETYTGSDGKPVTVTYYKKTYVLKASRAGWNQKVLDVGVNEGVQVDDPDHAGMKLVTLRPILDRGNKQVTKPVPLDGLGHKRPSVTDKPAQLTFRPYVSMDWTPINLTEVLP